MPVAYEVFAQSAPVAATDTTLYTVPAVTSIGYSIDICNRNATADTVTVWNRLAGAATANPQYIAFERTIEGNGLLQLTGHTAATTDIITIRSTNGTCSFTIGGARRT